MSKAVTHGGRGTISLVFYPPWVQGHGERHVSCIQHRGFPAAPHEANPAHVPGQSRDEQGTEAKEMKSGLEYERFGFPVPLLALK